MANHFASELKAKLEKRFVRDTADMSISDWVKQNTTIGGRQFTTKGYEFQEAILNDTHPNMDVIKCSQVGLTEIQIRKVLAWTYRNKGVASIFTLPEEKLFKRVAQTRIKPILQKDRVFRMGDEEQVRSMGIIQLGSSFVYVTGCTEGDATSTSADAIFNDEVDLSNQEMLALFNSRLQNSDYKIKQRFSTPTFPMFGIDLGYQASDKHQYLCRCDACNHWNNPKFNLNFIEVPGLPAHIEQLTDLETHDLDDIDLEGSYVKCEKCGTGLDLSNPELREWVPEVASRKHARGYRVSPFATGKLNPAYIITQMVDYKSRQFIRGWHNTVLGEPYSDGQMQLSYEAIKAAMKGGQTPEVGSDYPVAIGIDMGQTCHIVVGSLNKRTVFLFKAVHIDNLQEEIEKLCKRFNVVAGGIDRHPYTPTSNAIRDLSEGKIFPVEYSTNGPNYNLQKDQVSEEITHVRANRTFLIDGVSGEIRDGKAEFWGYSHQESIITEQLRDMWRDEKPESPAKWVKLTGNDHYFHALAFLRAGIEAMELKAALNKTEHRTMATVSLASPEEGDSKQLFGSSRSNRHFGSENIF